MLRLARIRADWWWFESARARDRDAWWRWVETVFGVEPWKLVAVHSECGHEIVVSRQKGLT